MNTIAPYLFHLMKWKRRPSNFHFVGRSMNFKGISLRGHRFRNTRRGRASIRWTRLSGGVPMELEANSFPFIFAHGKDWKGNEFSLIFENGKDWGIRGVRQFCGLNSGCKTQGNASGEWQENTGLAWGFALFGSFLCVTTLVET